ncbi:MAG TPA: DUF1294 domain-containing protein [Hyphomonas sp.]|nr:DUF1294 domain-containing protein [Hyphomonas sp.]
MTQPGRPSEAAAPPRSRGRLVSWNDERGYGFLVPDDGSGDVFAHANAFVKEGRHIEIGRIYDFDLEISGDGRRKANRVTLFVPPKQGPGLAAMLIQRGARFLVIPAFIFIALAVASSVPVSPNWWLIYAVASFTCFIGYGLDKFAAENKRWRVSETVLLLLGLAGGWPGGLIGQEVFRHKTQKKTFRTLFWMSVAINMAAFVQLNVFAAR